MEDYRKLLAKTEFHLDQMHEDGPGNMGFGLAQWVAFKSRTPFLEDVESYVRRECVSLDDVYMTLAIAAGVDHARIAEDRGMIGEVAATIPHENWQVIAARTAEAVGLRTQMRAYIDAGLEFLNPSGGVDRFEALGEDFQKGLLIAASFAFQESVRERVERMALIARAAGG